jgi:hypothetical protein
MESWSFGVMEYWSFGVMEFWSIGVMEYWSIGVMEGRRCQVSVFRCQVSSCGMLI